VGRGLILKFVMWTAIRLGGGILLNCLGCDINPVPSACLFPTGSPIPRKAAIQLDDE
jgi:hypothetical protein